MSYSETRGAVCIVDTCTLVYLNGVRLARRPLQEWLREEFEVKYSQAVLDELDKFKSQMQLKQDWKKYVWEPFNVSAYEQALFSTHQRRLEVSTCSHCKQRTWNNVLFSPSLEDTKDRGERHNCCVALDAAIKGRAPQVILLSDDLRAKRDYIDYFLETFPLGSFWSSLDMIIYLFIRHHKHIKPEDAIDALIKVDRKSVSKTSGAGSTHSIDQSNPRLTNYRRKVARITQIFKQLPGGYS